MVAAPAATMTQQGAALQNYNNELVKCERPRGGVHRAGWEGAGLAGLQAQAVAGPPRVAERGAWSVRGGLGSDGTGGRAGAPGAQPPCRTHLALGVCGVSARTDRWSAHCLPGARPMVWCWAFLDSRTPGRWDTSLARVEGGPASTGPSSTLLS